MEKKEEGRRREVALLATHLFLSSWRVTEARMIEILIDVVVVSRKRPINAAKLKKKN